MLPVLPNLYGSIKLLGAVIVVDRANWETTTISVIFRKNCQDLKTKWDFPANEPSKVSKQHQWPREEINARKLGTSANTEKSSTPRANPVFK